MELCVFAARMTQSYSDWHSDTMDQKNKFLVPLPTRNDWCSFDSYVDLKITEGKIRKWCEERIGKEGFPRWQFSLRTMVILSPVGSNTEMHDVAVGVFIFDDQMRLAFKLTFGVM